MSANESDVVLGIDVSTTSAKAILVNRAGKVIGLESSEYGFEVSRPLWSEQNPHSWWEAATICVRRVLTNSGVQANNVVAVGLAGQMHGLVLLDVTGLVIRPAILWNDQRTSAECDVIRTTIGRSRLIELTGNDALTGFTAPKLIWVRTHERDAYRQIAHILLPKDYVRFRLTGEFRTDCADGSGTLLFNLLERDWAQELISRLELDPVWFPIAQEGPVVCGEVSEEAARVLGLRAGTPVVAGAGDQAANAVGMGVVDPGAAALSIGTSGVLFVPSTTPVIEAQGQLHAFCHAVPDRWHLMGVMLSAAGSLRWFRDTFAPGSDYEDLLRQAATVRAGSEGLIFLPYLHGERTPHSDPLARAAFVGLTARHGIPHLTRAILEGVAFGLRDSLRLIRSSGVPVSAVRASGGGSRSLLWKQIIADILGIDVLSTSADEGAAYGAAILAAVGAGWFRSVAEACKAMVSVTGVTSVGPDLHQYEIAYEVFRDLYPALRPSLHRLGHESTQ